MSKKRKFSRTGLVLVLCMVICLLLALAVVPGGFGSDNKKDLDDENTPGIKTVIEDGSPLLIFDKRSSVKTLIADFDNDEVQSVSATISGSEGSSINVSSSDEITAVYKALKNVVVGDELDGEAPVDSSSSCSVSFVLSDGTSCDFQFEGKEVYTLDGTRYAAAGADGLWSTIQELANE